MSKLNKEDIIKKAFAFINDILDDNGYEGEHFAIKIILSDLKNKNINSGFYFDGRKGMYSQLDVREAEINVVKACTEDYKRHWQQTTNKPNETKQ